MRNYKAHTRNHKLRVGVQASPEIHVFHLDLVYMTVGIFDVARLRPFGQAAGIEVRTSVMEFVAPAMRYRECDVAVADAGQFRRHIGEMPGDHGSADNLPRDAIYR